MVSIKVTSHAESTELLLFHSNLNNTGISRERCLHPCYDMKIGFEILHSV